MTLPSTIVPGWDAGSDNVASVPAGLGVPAGYDTGSEGIPWTQAQWWTYPEAIHIDQSPVDTPWNEYSDVADIENSAVTIADAAAWYRVALANFTSAVRPGQRYPCFYVSMGNVTALVNALVYNEVQSGPCLWVADWSNYNQDTAAAYITENAATDPNPFPIVGFQYARGQFYDSDVFLASWIDNRSAVSAPNAPTVTSITVDFSNGTSQTLS